MKARTKFLKMFDKLPQLARQELVKSPYSGNPVTINVIAIEVKANTKLSKLLLTELGYADDA